MKKMTVLFVVLCLIASAPAFAADPLQADKAFTKLARGATNVVTCWGEYLNQLPASIDKSPDYLTGFFYNIFRGTGYTLKRGGIGLYEVVSFPFPGKNNYEPLMEPETIFTKTADALSN